MAVRYDTETRTVGDLHDWQMVLLDTRRNRYLFCISGNDFSLARDHLCLRHGWQRLVRTPTMRCCA